MKLLVLVYKKNIPEKNRDAMKTFAD